MLVAVFAVAEAGPLPPEAAAVVNGVTITRKSLLDVVQSLIAQLDDIPDTPTTEKYRRQALDSLVAFELLYQDGLARKLEVSNEEVAAEIKKTEQGFRSPKAYQEALKAKGLTKEDIERETRRALVVNRLLSDVVWPGVTASDEEIARYYDQHRTDFQHPAQIHVSYILIRAGKNASERDAAKAKAAELSRRVHNGEDFAAIARAESQDPATAPNGGDLDYIARGTMGQAFDDAAFALKPGEVSDPVESAFGFYVIKVVAERGPGVAPAAEVRSRIVAVIKGEGRDKAQEKFVAELRSRAAVEIAPDLR